VTDILCQSDREYISTLIGPAIVEVAAPLDRLPWYRTVQF